MGTFKALAVGAILLLAGAVHASQWVVGPSAVFNIANLSSSTVATINTAGYDAIEMQVITTSVPASTFTFSQTSVSTVTSNITLTGHMLTTGYAMWYATTTFSGTSKSPLLYGTTYYAIVNDANTIQVATTSARALAGQNVVITTKTAVGIDFMEFYPLDVSSEWQYAWYGSMDGTNYTLMSTTNFPSLGYSNSVSQTWYIDMLTHGYNYLQLKIISGTGGIMGGMYAMPWFRLFNIGE